MLNEAQKELARQIGSFYDDPLGFVLFSFPWGSGSLRGMTGPTAWQRDFLNDIAEEVRKRGFDGITAVDPIRYSTASGHGIGKSAMVAWIILWIMNTRPMARGIITANTGDQLRTRTWAELAKWNSMSITKHWWVITSGMGSLSFYHKDFRETWRADGQTCREENSEAFAGLHNKGSTPFYIFDEASAIPAKIFEVREGGLTDGEPMVFDFGNPTRNSGPFFDNMVGNKRHFYKRRFIDSRDVEITNKKQLQDIIDMFGADSDQAKVRVYGQFPDQSSAQLIPSSYYDDNVEFDVHVAKHQPLIMGVDVARFGDDQTVIWMRRGRDAATHNDWDRQIMREADTLQVAGRVGEIARQFNPDIINVDGGGVGGGVVDTLRGWGFDVNEINFGGKASERGYFNKRAEMWAKMRDALAEGVRLPDMPDLRADLTSLEYSWSPKNDLVLEKKEDAKKRGLKSPDLADALALTWAVAYAPLHRPSWEGADDNAHDYNPFDD